MRPCGADGQGRRLPFDGALKRALAVLISAGVLVSLTPLFAVTCMLLWAERGKVFRRELFIGRGGRVFRRVRFQTRDHVGRRSPVGAYLEQSGVDGVPQFWNVLRGDMALVGPAPATAAQLEVYGPLSDAYLSLRPGLTGPWRLDGAPAPLVRRVELDAEYVRRRCVLMDAGIVLRSTFLFLREQA